MDGCATNERFKEGGIGWVIVGSCYLLALITMDVCGSFGIFMIECSERYVSFYFIQCLLLANNIGQRKNMYYQYEVTLQ